MSLHELKTVKYYYTLYLAKRFIQKNSALYLSSILFVKKSGRRI